MSVQQIGQSILKAPLPYCLGVMSPRFTSGFFFVPNSVSAVIVGGFVLSTAFSNSFSGILETQIAVFC
jgi:hypothetical protein